MRPAPPRCRRALGLIAAAAAGGALALPATGIGATAPAPPTTLAAGTTLASGQSLSSPDGHYSVAMQSTGDLVEQTADGRVLWSSGTSGNRGAHAVMQSNGNLVIETSGGAVVYSTNSHSTGCPRLVLQDDGNLVIYGGTQAAWADGVTQTTLWAGDELQSGWSIHARPETVRLRMRPDGDLVLVDAVERVLWSTRTAGHAGARAVMQGDGNLIVDTPGGAALWSSGTAGHRNAHLTVRSDGDLVLVGTDGTVLWSSHTAGKATGGSMASGAPPAVTCPSPTTSRPTTPTTTTAPTPPPVPVSPAPVTTPVPTPPPAPVRAPASRPLRIRMAISWTWDRAVTRVRHVRVGSAPGTVRLTLSCRGRGCPRRRTRTRATGLRRLHRMLAGLAGRRYRAGEELLLTLTASGWAPERVSIRFRWGQVPQIRLLRR